MPKGNLFEDTFEQLVELGQSTTKKTVKSVAQTFNPLSSLTGNEKESNADSIESQTEKLKNKKDNHTPLDFDRLQNKFKDKEEVAAEALRNRLFQMVKQGDEKLLMEKRQAELEKRRKEEYEEEEKKRKEKKQKQQQSDDIPLGKIRKSIFSPKKVAERSHVETKPTVGKQ